MGEKSCSCTCCGWGGRSWGGACCGGRGGDGCAAAPGSVSSVHTPTLPNTPTPKKVQPQVQAKITRFLHPCPPPPQEITAKHHTTRQEVAQPGLAGRVHPKFTATPTKFITEMVKNAPSEPLAKALAQAQGGGGDSAAGGVVPGGDVRPPPSPASAAGGSVGLVPPPAPLQLRESTWCPSATGKALGFTQAGDTLPLTQILPLAKAQGPTQSLSMVGGKAEERETEIEHSPLSTPDRSTVEVQLEITENEKFREGTRERVDLTVPQLSETKKHA